MLLIIPSLHSLSYNSNNNNNNNNKNNNTNNNNNNNNLGQTMRPTDYQQKREPAE